MSNQSPTANGAGQGPDAPMDQQNDQKNPAERNRTEPENRPVKGTDTPATTRAEDLDPADRTTM